MKPIYEQPNGVVLEGTTNGETIKIVDGIKLEVVDDYCIFLDITVDGFRRELEIHSITNAGIKYTMSEDLSLNDIGRICIAVYHWGEFPLASQPSEHLKHITDINIPKEALILDDSLLHISLEFPGIEELIDYHDESEAYVKMSIDDATPYLRGSILREYSGADIRYQFHLIEKDTDVGRMSFWQQDFYTLMQKEFPDDLPKIIVEILDIHVDEGIRNKAVGSWALFDLVNELKERGLNMIFVMSGASEREYSEEPTNEEYAIILERLGRFYERNGFVNINNLIANYEYRELFALDTPEIRKYLSIDK